jgi:formate dehydrogenase subunit gamma
VDIPKTPPSADLPPGFLRRFVVAERLSHWLYAVFFLVAFVSGLLTWLPPTREWMAGARQTVTLYHGAIGFVMVAVPLLLFLILDRRRLYHDVREVDRWSWNDRRWFWLAVRGYTLRGRRMPPQGRFNAGQKFNVVLVAAMALGFAVTGGILMHRENVPAWLVSRALWLHGILAILAIALFLGHLAHVFFTRHGRDYLRGMIGGNVPEELARQRHRRWWEQETGHSDTDDGAAREEAGGGNGV